MWERNRLHEGLSPRATLSLPGSGFNKRQAGRACFRLDLDILDSGPNQPLLRSNVDLYPRCVCVTARECSRARRADHRKGRRSMTLQEKELRDTNSVAARLRSQGFRYDASRSRWAL